MAAENGCHDDASRLDAISKYYEQTLDVYEINIFNVCFRSDLSCNAMLMIMIAYAMLAMRCL